ncbi:hypothetical protein BCV69DRAFT_29127 [Microstroma glucosiphilum]|uniref:Uncharacterized protein n=1 Tax=Pseudomicrostroma glucosiphilum TaxID=1684307 RepID=A0A316U2Y8_9BASI|nr:hypothetical protein BCV69DRAFT_29127 [Pseudomicrostroma glucosiphilum]PWN19686.1 hypothetical protein BCV69DRAFT_29127 [Pseudomicrostroma glucosiphilum]
MPAVVAVVGSSPVKRESEGMIISASGPFSFYSALFLLNRSSREASLRCNATHSLGCAIPALLRVSSLLGVLTSLRWVVVLLSSSTSVVLLGKAKVHARRGWGEIRSMAVQMVEWRMGLRLEGHGPTHPLVMILLPRGYREEVQAESSLPMPCRVGLRDRLSSSTLGGHRTTPRNFLPS